MTMSNLHRVTQHRSGLPGIEARTIASDRTFPRQSHDQLGIGVMLSGAHRSWSSIGHVEARAGDVIMVNPGEMHDGMPAELSGVSRFQLVRGFVREVGTTPHAYLVQRRICLARRLLIRGQSIAEAAMNAGFADQSHLTHAFVRHFRVTPWRYVAAIA